MTEGSRPCHLCGGRSFRLLTQRRSPRKHPTQVSAREEFRILCCKKCGLGAVDPMPTDFTDLYKDGSSSPFEYYRRCAAADRRTFRTILGRVSPFLPRGRILDVGCAAGTFIETARENGYSTDGVEISPDCAARCRGRGFNVAECGVESIPNDWRGYDLVHMGDVLEHLSAPLDTLRDLRLRLNENGLIVISTPNLVSFAARIFQIKPREHLYYFTKRALARLLTTAGFSPLTLTTFDRWRDLGSLHYSSTFAVAGFGRWLAETLAKSILKNMILRFPFRENLFCIARRTPDSAD